MDTAVRGRFLCRFILGIGIACAPAGAAPPHATAGLGAAAPRAFLLQYDVTVTGLAPPQVARVWVPVPATDADQAAEVVSRDLPPTASIAEDGRLHNRILYAEAHPGPGGDVHLALTYRVVRQEVVAGPAPAGEADAVAFLGPDRRVPVGGKALRWTAGMAMPADSLALALRLYDLVDDHMVYAKDRPGWGNGDSDWACDSGRGNCTDFHSVFISLARAYRIPAKFEIGLTVPARERSGTISGYHCWAKFRAATGVWVPVDIAEASKHPEARDYYFGHLPPDRVRLSTGRDIVLTPRQDGPPLNYFVYPYVEVGGKPYPADKVTATVSFRDLPKPDAR